MINPFKFDYINFETKLTAFYRAFVIKCHERYPGEVFYWYGLDTYEEFGPLRPIAIREAEIERRVEKTVQTGMNRQNLDDYWRYNMAMYREHLTEDDMIGLESARDELHAITAKGQRQFDGTFVTARLELGEVKSQEYVQPLIEKYRAVCIRVLQRLDNEGLFCMTTDRNNVLVTFQLYDEFEPHDLETLNPPDVMLRYRTVKAQAESLDKQISENMKRGDS